MKTIEPTITSSFLPGKLGDYELVSELGKGEMGTVYKAILTKLGRVFALKIVHPDLVTDPIIMRRFEQEVAAASSLTHANLASVYDYGCTESGSPFVVMDYIDGRELAALIHEGPLKPRRAIEIFLQVADALGYAHGSNVIHRDIKPSNILVTEADGIEHVKVLDFGIAKVLDAAKTNFDKITQTAQVLGTPLYMSPEQCLGEKLDARSDIYSFGCVMYEALYAVAPFVGANAVQTVLKQVNESLPPSPLPTADRKPARELDFVVRKALAKQPEDRYQSMEALKLDLMRVKAGKSVVRRTHSKKATARPFLIVLTLYATWFFIMLYASTPTTIQTSVQLPSTPAQMAAQSQPVDIMNADGKWLRKYYAYIQNVEIREIKSTSGRLLYRTSLPFVAEESYSGDTLMSYVIAKNQDLSEAQLTGADLRHAKFIGCKFKKAQLVGAVLNGARFVDCDFEGACLTGAGSGHSTSSVPSSAAVAYQHCKFRHADLTGWHCYGDRLEDCDFTGSNCAGVNFQRCAFQKSCFNHCDLSDANLTLARFDHCQLNDCNLRAANLHWTLLSHCGMQRTSFLGAALGTTVFLSTSLRDCDFKDANVDDNASHYHYDPAASEIYDRDNGTNTTAPPDGVFFLKRSLSRSEFRSCDLSGCNLRNGDIFKYLSKDEAK